jgi:aminopeptidase-like protein
MDNNIQDYMYGWLGELFPVCRSITGKGLEYTLSYLQQLIPELNIIKVPSGTKVFDWEVPEEWNINDAFIKNSTGERLVDFKKNNLHVLGYSIPVDDKLSLEELQQHLYSLPDKPDVIPYMTSYYKKRWGFCLSHNQRKQLPSGTYHVQIDSSLSNGHLHYGEVILPGRSQKEILLSTYVCHPSMANNELSGPVVTTAIVQWLKTLDRKYTYRIVFVPETIGSITYLSKNYQTMKKNTIAGFVITCVGDNRTYSYLASPSGSTLSDRCICHVLEHKIKNYKSYSFLERGSDERQYCSPGIDLPVCSFSRSKYGEYPEYHTSLDDLSLVSPKGLGGAYDVMKDALWLLENNEIYQSKVLCEPQLGKRGLYPTLSGLNPLTQDLKMMRNLIAYANGKRDLLTISEKINSYMGDLIPIANLLLEKEVIEIL